MFKYFSYLLYKFFKILDLILKKLINRSFFFWFKKFIEDDSYKKLNILDKNINFFVPNKLIDYRVNSFFF